MKLLTEEESKKITEAVSEVEKTTGAEISTAFISESDDYSFRELLVAVSGGLLAFIGLAALSDPLNRLLDGIFWNRPTAALPVLLGLAGLIVGVLIYFLTQIPAVDRLIIPRKVREEAVRRRALRFFTESGIYDTRDRTGILIFVSRLEKRVVLLADRGINEKVAPDTWDRIVSALLRGIREDRSAEAMVEAVKACGGILAEHVMRAEDDENELADKPTELEKGS